MIQFEIKRESFVNYFLNPIKKINIEGTCSLYSKDGKLCSLAATADKSVVIFATHKPESEIEDFDTVHISDVKRLILALKCIGSENIVLTLDEEKLSHDGKDFKFFTYLLDPKFANSVNVKPDRIDSIKSDVEFSVTPKAMKGVKVAQMVAPDATKLYFYTENGQVFVNLNDKKKSKIDNASVIVSESYNGNEISSPFVISGEVFKLITQFDDPVIFRLNTTKGVLIVETVSEQYSLKYITSALVK